MGIGSVLSKAIDPRTAWNPIKTSDIARKATHRALLKPGTAKKATRRTAWAKNREWFVPLAAAVATWYIGGAGGVAATQGTTAAGVGGSAATTGGTAATAGGSLSSAVAVGSTTSTGMQKAEEIEALKEADKRAVKAERAAKKVERQEIVRLAQLAYSGRYMGGSRNLLKAGGGRGRQALG